MPSYVKRRWNESRGDEFDSWGKSWWYFEVEIDGAVVRQIEQYDAGIVLKYGPTHSEDNYGFLSYQPLDMTEPEWESVEQAEFQRIWQDLVAINA